MLSEEEFEKIIGDNIHIAAQSDEWAVDIIAGIMEDVPNAAHAIAERVAQDVAELKAENERLRRRVKKLKKQRDDWKAMYALDNVSESRFYGD